VAPCKRYFHVLNSRCGKCYHNGKGNNHSVSEHVG
jgi:hypothetical protein